MKEHYAGFSQRMMSEIESISGRMSHLGERGRNNEQVLIAFLEQNLPRRYTVSTGKVISATGQESGQIDVIIHDRFETPELMEARAWRFVPVESVYAVISVKTSLDKSELRDAMTSIQSVRSLSRTAAMAATPLGFAPVPEDKVLRPRALVFAFKSLWSSSSGTDNAFKELLSEIPDAVRPNGVCTMNQCFITRRPYKTETLIFDQHPLLHFFLFLVKTMDRFRRYRVDFSKYFTEDYGQSIDTANNSLEGDAGNPRASG